MSNVANKFKTTACYFKTYELSKNILRDK